MKHRDLFRFFLTAAAAVLGIAACKVEAGMPERFAIVYGVEAYTNSYNPDPALNNHSYNLDYAADDAQSVYGMLTARGYPAANVVLRTDSAATKAQLQNDVGTIASMAKADSTFLFFYSGHGYRYPHPGDAEGGDQDLQTEFLVPYGGIDPVTGQKVVTNLVSDDDLMRLLSYIPSRNKIVLIDACYSGGFIGDSPGSDGGSAADAFAKYFANVDEGDIAYTEALVVTAAGETEASYEAGEYEGVTYDHGLFTYFLLRTPARADRNGDGWITATEAYAYTKDRLWENLSLLPRISGGALDFALFEAD